MGAETMLTQWQTCPCSTIDDFFRDFTTGWVQMDPRLGTPMWKCDFCVQRRKVERFHAIQLRLG